MNEIKSEVYIHNDLKKKMILNLVETDLEHFGNRSMHTDGPV